MTHKFIAYDETGYLASDADTLTTLGIGNVVPGNEYISKFILGNAGTDDSTFHIGIDTVNSGIVDDFELSTDGVTYESGNVGVDVFIEAGRRSDPLYLKYTVDVQSYISSGTIKLDVT